MPVIFKCDSTWTFTPLVATARGVINKSQFSGAIHLPENSGKGLRFYLRSPGPRRGRPSRERSRTYRRVSFPIQTLMKGGWKRRGGRSRGITHSILSGDPLRSSSRCCAADNDSRKASHRASPQSTAAALWIWRTMSAMGTPAYP